MEQKLWKWKEQGQFELDDGAEGKAGVVGVYLCVVCAQMCLENKINGTTK